MMLLSRWLQCKRAGSSLMAVNLIRLRQCYGSCYLWGSSVRSMSSSASFKDSLRLPQSAMPQRVSKPEVRESELLPLSGELYEWQSTQLDRRRFIIHDGPPYANGDLHVGHLLNKVLKDAIGRHRVMMGDRLDFVPGWDCHGLPIELKALEIDQRSNADAVPPRTPQEIRFKAAQLAESVLEQHRVQMQSWGILADWKNVYRTMCPSYEAAQIDVFAEMMQSGLLYRDHKPVHWSPSSKTALAEAELDYRSDHTSTSVFVGFPIVNSSGPRSLLDNCSAVIWTTTPWTLPANSAIAYKADANYSIVEDRDDRRRFLVALERLDEFKRVHGRDIEVQQSFPGLELAEIRARHVLDDHVEVPFVESEFVNLDAGSGLVHTAPAHGRDDFVLGRRYALRMPCPVDDDGHFTAEAGHGLKGKFVLGAGNRAVLELLAEKHALLHQERYVHSYPYDWRTKKPVIQRSTPQWFAKLDHIREEALEALKSVKIIPEGGQRLHSMIASRDEWCISRQRSWGVPIPVFYDVESGETLATPSSIAHVRALVAEHGSDCWWNLPIDELLAPEYRNNGRTYARGLDTLDVWFDSGVSWRAAMADRGRELPFDVVLEGSDQHRGWFQSSLLTSVACGEGAPFKSIITHGFVLDKNSRKMSKSLGNVMCPRKLVAEQGGVDALRWWVGCADFTVDVAISDVILKKAAGNVQRLRNTCRFLLGCLEDFTVHDRVAYAQLRPLDRFALHQLAELAATVDSAYADHNFARVTSSLHHFTSSFWSSFYVHTCKDRVYADASSSLGRRSAQTVMSFVLPVLTKAMAPFAVFTAEDVFAFTPEVLKSIFNETQSEDVSDHCRIDSVFACGWFPSDISTFRNEELARDWDLFMRLRDHVNRVLEEARDQRLIGSSLEADLHLDILSSSPLSFTTINEGIHER